MKAIHTGLAILLVVCGILSPPCVYPSHITLHQAAKGKNTSYDELADFLESIDHLLKPLDVYTQIPPTPAMDDIVLKIMAELLSMLALTTKELKHGRPSESVLVDVSRYLMKCREICNEDFWSKGRRGDPTEVRSTLSR